jgi:hypothetical protein
MPTASAPYYKYLEGYSKNLAEFMHYGTNFDFKTTMNAASI